MKNTIILTLFGFVSGILSFLLTKQLSAIVGTERLVPFTYPLQFIAGLIFGIFIALFASLFIKNSKFSYLKLLLWTIISIVSYEIAVQIVIADATTSDPTKISFLIAGGVGALCMLLGFHFIISRLTLLQFLCLTITGSILGLSWFLNIEPYSVVNSLPKNLLYLFVFWQTGMAYGLGICLDRNKESTQAPV